MVEKSDTHQTHTIKIDDSFSVVKFGSNMAGTNFNPDVLEDQAIDIVRGFLSVFQSKFRYCKVCGGIIPELSVEYRDKEYFFTLWKITEKGKTVKETKYKRLAKHLKPYLLEKKRG